MLRHISFFFFPLRILSWLPAMSNFRLFEADVSSLHMTVLNQFFFHQPVWSLLNSDKMSQPAASCSKKFHNLTTHGVWSHFLSFVTPVSFIWSPLLRVVEMSEHSDSLFTLSTLILILQTYIKHPSSKSSSLFSYEQSNQNCSPLHPNCRERKERR